MGNTNLKKSKSSYNSSLTYEPCGSNNLLPTLKIQSADSTNNGASCSNSTHPVNSLSNHHIPQIHTSSSTNMKVPKRTSKITIPFDRWIKYDCRKWGHFKDFDFYSLNETSQANNNNNNNNNSQANNIIITINNQNINALTLFSHSNNNQANQNNESNTNSNNLSNSYFLSANLNLNINPPIPNNNYTILSPFLSNESNKNNQSNNNTNSSGNNNNNNNSLTQLHYVNGHFFKPIERLGDSQFIISQLPYQDVIVTVPCNISRYKQNDKTVKETISKLNRVIAVCEKFIVFQIWKGNNEVEVFIYEYKNSCTVSDETSSTNSLVKSNQSSNRIVRKLNRRFNSRTYACLISPDRTFLLITPDYELNYSYSHHTHSHAECTIIININTFQLLRVISARCDQRFAFDPRYGLPNYQAPRFAEFDTVRGQIFDLSLEKVIVCSNHTLKTKVFRVEYTKDGYLIIVICTLPVFHRRARRNYFIYILNSSTLLHMRSIIDYRGPLLTTYMFSNDFNLLFNMYPSLSNCASSIAVLKCIEPSLNTRVIELYTLPNVCSMSLKELCRRVILRHVDSKHLNQLPLPPKLITYLSFNNDIYNVNSKNNQVNFSKTNNQSKRNTNVYYNNRQNMIVQNLSRNFSNKFLILQTRFNQNKRSLTNFLLQTRQGR